MKRKRKAVGDTRAVKRQRQSNETQHTQSAWPLLRHYYPHVRTLRQHLASRLVAGSKRRRRAILLYGTYGERQSPEVDAKLVDLLDHVVIGSFEYPDSNSGRNIERDITVFTQQVSSSTPLISLSQGALKQSEIVDFTIWSLFRRSNGPHRPAHVLCDGFQRHASDANNGQSLHVIPGVPGVFCAVANSHVKTLKQHPWTLLPSLLGRSAEGIIGDMLINCGLFVAVDGSNLMQLSGVPMTDLSILRPLSDGQQRQLSVRDSRKDSSRVGKSSLLAERQRSDIRFLRQRMLYARPRLNAAGAVGFGLSAVHVFNRHCNLDDPQQDICALQYIFPRQFGLHNVFTSDVDPRNTGQPYMDYTLRESEIGRWDRRWKEKRVQAECTEEQTQIPPLPKRLRSRILEHVRRLRKRHSKCPYTALLQHYCPRPRGGSSESAGLLHHASNLAQVSAFCRAVTSKVFPDDLWGVGDTRKHNKRVLAQKIDTFVRMRRYETLSLHDILQDFRIRGIHWLAPPDIPSGERMSRPDFSKREQLLAELLYYLFDSFLMPLIRGHFHVTESGAHRNQLFYFRQDVWEQYSSPALSDFQRTMLEPFRTADIHRKVASRALGVSRVRLLPKEKGMRPIVNLRRRVQKLQGGQLILGRSINSILNPVFSALRFEKDTHRWPLGSALFSADDLYPRLQKFRHQLQQHGLVVGQTPLFFAKVDVRACFDTIPQARLMRLASAILRADTYQISKYARAKLVGDRPSTEAGHNASTNFGAKPSWRYLTKAQADAAGPFDLPAEIATDTSTNGRTRTIYVGTGGASRSERRPALLKLLQEHVECNVLQIGRRFYRQRTGIPQGSIVSTLLCNYFYAELEREALSFVHTEEGAGGGRGHVSVLLRLIDDFLVISTDRATAARFVQVMHAGLPEYGVEVRTEKSRVNFELQIEDGSVVPRLPPEVDFPYCGCAINTATLDLSKDRERRWKSNLPDSVSVEYSKLPGQTFYRKTLNALKLQMQAMLLSTNYNSVQTVLANLHHAFSEVALKSYYYIRSLPTTKRPAGKLLIKTVDDLINLASSLMKHRKPSSKEVIPYECCVTPTQTRWLACTAFQGVFGRRQTNFQRLLNWLKAQLMATRTSKVTEMMTMRT